MIDYEGDWTNKSLFSYIYQHRFQPLTNATTLYINSCSRDPKIKRFVLFQDSDKEPHYMENLTNLTVYFPETNFGWIICRNSYKTCQKFGMKYHSFAQLAVVEPKWNKYYIYDGEFEDEKVADFLEKALEGNWPALGPGAGWKGFFYNLGVFLRLPKVVFSIFSVLITTFACLMLCCERRRRRRRRNKPIIPTNPDLISVSPQTSTEIAESLNQEKNENTENVEDKTKTD